MRRPASLFMQADAREASGRHRPPATTSGTCERTNHDVEGHAHVQGPEMALRRVRGQQTAAVERREASVPRRTDCESGSVRGRADLRHGSALQRVPLHPSACRRSTSLFCEREKCKPRRASYASRER